MDVEEEIKGIIRNSRGEIDIWALIKIAVKLATQEYPNEVEFHRDDIVHKLYQCPTCGINKNNNKEVRESSRAVKSPSTTPVSVDDEDDENVKELKRKVDAAFGDDDDENDNIVVDDDDVNNNNTNTINNVNDGEFHHDENDEDVDDDVDDELRRIFSIKEQIEDPDQSEDSLVDLLQSLADMDITFKALKETDIGRYVNRLRKHPSGEVRRLVKILVRKWKELVDEWVSSAKPGVQPSNNLMDGDSPQRNVSKIHQNGHRNQVPDFGYSPNPHNGGSSSDRNYSEPEPKPRVAGAPLRRDPPSKLYRSPSAPASAPAPNRQKEVAIDPDRLASARKRLHENYQEAQNAKKQRTIQVMDIHEIPKPRNGFVKHKGGFQRH